MKIQEKQAIFYPWSPIFLDIAGVVSIVIWMCTRAIDYLIILFSPLLTLRIFNFIKQIPSESIPKPTYTVFLILTMLIELISKFLLYGFLRYKHPGFIVFFIIGYIANIIPTLVNLLVIGVPCRFLVKSFQNAVREENNLIDVITLFKQFQNLSSPYIFVLFSGFTCRLVLSIYNLAFNLNCDGFELVRFSWVLY